jgi:hypothetical protein
VDALNTEKLVTVGIGGALLLGVVVMVSSEPVRRIVWNALFTLGRRLNLLRPRHADWPTITVVAGKRGQECYGASVN